MQMFFDCCPAGFEGDRDILTVEVPSAIMDEVAQYARAIAYEKGVKEQRILNDIVRKSIQTIENQSYDRKNRKTKKW